MLTTVIARTKKPNDEQSFYIDSDDSDDYLGESLDRRVELQKKTGGRKSRRKGPDII